MPDNQTTPMRIFNCVCGGICGGLLLSSFCSLVVLASLAVVWLCARPLSAMCTFLAFGFVVGFGLGVREVWKNG